MADNKLFSPDAEVQVLASILKTPSLVHLTNGLQNYMFSSTHHTILFQEFEELREQNFLPDPQIVITSLESKNLLDKVGGKKYIEVLLGKETNDDAFVKYVEILVASYKGRSYLSILAGGKKDDLNIENIDDKIQLTKQSLEQLIGMGGGNSTIHVSEITKATFDEIIARMAKPGIRGTTWGVSSIDKMTGGKSPGDLIVIAGRPGAGKSSVMCNSILADAKEGIPSLLISREMRPQELMERMISIDTGIPNTNIRMGMLNQAQVDGIYASLEKIKKLPLYMDYNFNCTEPFYLESTINKYRKQKGIEIVYLDYIQISTERDEGQTQEIGRLTQLFKRMCNQLNICSVLLSQLNRGVESRDDKRPLLSDMKQSGAIEEDADFVIGLYRDEYYNAESKAKGLMEYIILKHRNGPPGTITIKYDAPTYRMSDT